MSAIQKLLSEKGKPMITHLDYTYMKEKETTAKIIFRCQNRSCKGKLIVSSYKLKR